MTAVNIFVLTIFCSTYTLSRGQGVLTIRLTGFQNSQGRTYDGSCCDPSPGDVSNHCVDQCDYVMRLIVSGLGRANDHVFLFHRPIQYDSNNLEFEQGKNELLTVLFDEWPVDGHVKVNVFFYDYDDFDHTTTLVDWFETDLKSPDHRVDTFHTQTVIGNRQSDKTLLKFDWSATCDDHDCLTLGQMTPTQKPVNPTTWTDPLPTLLYADWRKGENFGVHADYISTSESEFGNKNPYATHPLPDNHVHLPYQTREKQPGIGTERPGLPFYKRNPFPRLNSHYSDDTVSPTAELLQDDLESSVLDQNYLNQKVKFDTSHNYPQGIRNKNAGNIQAQRVQLGKFRQNYGHLGSNLKNRFVSKPAFKKTKSINTYQNHIPNDDSAEGTKASEETISNFLTRYNSKTRYSPDGRDSQRLSRLRATNLLNHLVQDISDRWTTGQPAPQSTKTTVPRQWQSQAHHKLRRQYRKRKKSKPYAVSERDNNINTQTSLSQLINTKTVRDRNTRAWDQLKKPSTSISMEKSLQNRNNEHIKQHFSNQDTHDTVNKVETGSKEGNTKKTQEVKNEKLTQGEGKGDHDLVSNTENNISDEQDTFINSDIQINGLPRTKPTEDFKRLHDSSLINSETNRNRDRISTDEPLQDYIKNNEWNKESNLLYIPTTTPDTSTALFSSMSLSMRDPNQEPDYDIYPTDVISNSISNLLNKERHVRILDDANKAGKPNIRDDTTESPNKIFEITESTQAAKVIEQSERYAGEVTYPPDTRSPPSVTVSATESPNTEQISLKLYDTAEELAQSKKDSLSQELETFPDALAESSEQNFQNIRLQSVTSLSHESASQLETSTTEVHNEKPLDHDMFMVIPDGQSSSESMSEKIREANRISKTQDIMGSQALKTFTASFLQDTQSTIGTTVSQNKKTSDLPEGQAFTISSLGGLELTTGTPFQDNERINKISDYQSYTLLKGDSRIFDEQSLQLDENIHKLSNFQTTTAPSSRETRLGWQSFHNMASWENLDGQLDRKNSERWLDNNVEEGETKVQAKRFPTSDFRLAPDMEKTRQEINERSTTKTWRDRSYQKPKLKLFQIDVTVSPTIAKTTKEQTSLPFQQDSPDADAGHLRDSKDMLVEKDKKIDEEMEKKQKIKFTMSEKLSRPDNMALLRHSIKILKSVKFQTHSPVVWFVTEHPAFRHGWIHSRNTNTGEQYEDGDNQHGDTTLSATPPTVTQSEHLESRVKSAATLVNETFSSVAQSSSTDRSSFSNFIENQSPLPLALPQVLNHYKTSQNSLQQETTLQDREFSVIGDNRDQEDNELYIFGRSSPFEKKTSRTPLVVPGSSTQSTQYVESRNSKTMNKLGLKKDTESDAMSVDESAKLKEDEVKEHMLSDSWRNGYSGRSEGIIDVSSTTIHHMSSNTDGLNEVTTQSVLSHQPAQTLNSPSGQQHKNQYSEPSSDYSSHRKQKIKYSEEKSNPIPHSSGSDPQDIIWQTFQTLENQNAHSVDTGSADNFKINERKLDHGNTDNDSFYDFADSKNMDKSKLVKHIKDIDFNVVTSATMDPHITNTVDVAAQISSFKDVSPNFEPLSPQKDNLETRHEKLDTNLLSPFKKVTASVSDVVNDVTYSPFQHDKGQEMYLENLYQVNKHRSDSVFGKQQLDWAKQENTMEEFKDEMDDGDVQTGAGKTETADDTFNKYGKETVSFFKSHFRTHSSENEHQTNEGSQTKLTNTIEPYPFMARNVGDIETKKYVSGVVRESERFTEGLALTSLGNPALDRHHSFSTKESDSKLHGADPSTALPREETEQKVFNHFKKVEIPGVLPYHERSPGSMLNGVTMFAGKTTDQTQNTIRREDSAPENENSSWMKEILPLNQRKVDEGLTQDHMLSGSVDTSTPTSTNLDVGKSNLIDEGPNLTQQMPWVKILSTLIPWTNVALTPRRNTMMDESPPSTTMNKLYDRRVIEVQDTSVQPSQKNSHVVNRLLIPESTTVNSQTTTFTINTNHEGNFESSEKLRSASHPKATMSHSSDEPSDFNNNSRDTTIADIQRSASVSIDPTKSLSPTLDTFVFNNDPPVGHKSTNSAISGSTNSLSPLTNALSDHEIRNGHALSHSTSSVPLITTYPTHEPNGHSSVHSQVSTIHRNSDASASNIPTNRDPTHSTTVSHRDYPPFDNPTNGNPFKSQNSPNPNDPSTSVSYIDKHLRISTNPSHSSNTKSKFTTDVFNTVPGVPNNYTPPDDIRTGSITHHTDDITNNNTPQDDIRIELITHSSDDVTSNVKQYNLQTDLTTHWKDDITNRHTLIDRYVSSQTPVHSSPQTGHIHKTTFSEVSNSDVLSLLVEVTQTTAQSHQPISQSPDTGDSYTEKQRFMSATQQTQTHTPHSVGSTSSYYSPISTLSYNDDKQWSESTEQNPHSSTFLGSYPTDTYTSQSTSEAIRTNQPKTSASTQGDQSTGLISTEKLSVDIERLISSSEPNDIQPSILSSMPSTTPIGYKKTSHAPGSSPIGMTGKNNPPSHTLNGAHISTIREHRTLPQSPVTAPTAAFNDHRPSNNDNSNLRTFDLHPESENIFENFDHGALLPPPKNKMATKSPTTMATTKVFRPNTQALPDHGFVLHVNPSPKSGPRTEPSPNPFDLEPALTFKPRRTASPRSAVIDVDKVRHYLYSIRRAPTVHVPVGGLYTPRLNTSIAGNSTTSSVSHWNSTHGGLSAALVSRVDVAGVMTRYWPAMLGALVGTAFLLTGLITSVIWRQRRLLVRARWIDSPHHVTEPPDTSEYTSSSASLTSDGTRRSLRLT